ncbi:MAG: sialidase family protein [Clostridia bacterium]
MDGPEGTGGVKIVRLAPGSGQLDLEVQDAGDEVSFLVHGEGLSLRSIRTKHIQDGLHRMTGLKDGVDYEVRALTKDGRQSRTRLFRCGEVPGTVVNYIHPEDKTYMPSGMCPASPSIVEFRDRLIVSHDIFFRDCRQDTTLLFHSTDQGKTWRSLACLQPCFWGKLFVHRDTLYMLCNSREYGDLTIIRSNDGGSTWGRPSLILKGGDNVIGGPHKGPMPVLSHGGRLWTALDYGAWSLKGHASGLISVDENLDISDGKNWEVSAFLPYDTAWEGAVSGESGGLLEGNILARPDGRLINLLRYQTTGCQPSYGKAIFLFADRDKLSFGKVIDFHGNNSKFNVYHDERTGKYWTIANRADENHPGRRNTLVLMSSVDTEHWGIEKTLLDYENKSWHEDREKVGFQYVDFVFHGNEIFYVSRTALNGALNYHDSNQITFHRVTYI